MKKQLNKKGFTLIELLVVITIIGVLATISFSGYSRFIENARITKTVAVAKNVFNAMTSFASDNNGKFPQIGATTSDGTGTFATAEDAFREFIVKEYVSDETDFSVDNSPVELDGFVGDAPDYADAFSDADGGVHWSLIGNGTQTMRGSAPLAWENGSTEGWDPSWDPTKAGQPVKGRTWSGGKVVVVTISGKAEALEVEDITAESKLKSLGTGSKNVFTAAFADMEVLDSGILK